jgi:enoyl-CoA hydratase/carnithine racemase
MTSLQTPGAAGTVERSEAAPGVVLLRITHERRLGALTPTMRDQLGAAWRSIADDPNVRAVVLTGTGRGFSTGLDVVAAAEGDDPASEFASSEDLPAFGMSPIDFDVWVPYIVAVNGVCAGGGFHLLTDADIVIAGAGASFLDPHVSVGQVSALEPIALLRRLPLETVTRMVVLGRHGRISAADAHRVGLVSEVVADDTVVQRAVELGSLATTGSPAAIAASKRALRASLQVGLDEGLRIGWDAIRDHWNHPDYAEGLAAFSDSRPPQWA